jgi:oligopeptidase A
LARILELRQQKAELLGHRNFSELALSERMAGSKERVAELIDAAATALAPEAEREFARASELHRALEGPNAGPPAPWDMSFYRAKLRAQASGLDEDAVRAYLPFPRVLEGLFSTVETLLGISIARLPNAETPDPSVEAYEIRDDQGTRRAVFYVDAFLRPGKTMTAQQFQLRVGQAERDGTRSPHESVLFLDFEAPSEGGTTYLSHQDMTLLFHEFGHLLHECLSQTQGRALSGTRVSRDFIEVPSQLLENWAYEPKVLALCSAHRDSGAPMPKEMIEALRERRGAMEREAARGLLKGAALDLALHSELAASRRPLDGATVLAFSRSVQQRFDRARLPDELDHVNRIPHLCLAPYAGGVHAYLWSKFIEADLYGPFRAKGDPLDRALGRRLRELLLESGDSVDPTEICRAWLGRDPDLEAYLTRLKS